MATKGIVETNHPPLEPFTYGNKNIQAILILPTKSKKYDTYATKELVSQVQEQQNFFNLILKTINNQTEMIETILNLVEPVINYIEIMVITKQNPLLKPPTEKPSVIPS